MVKHIVSFRLTSFRDIKEKDDQLRKMASAIAREKAIVDYEF